MRCMCGDPDCWHFEADYPYCRPCDEHHRAPECDVDEQGRSLSPFGEPYDESQTVSYRTESGMSVIERRSG